jgi:hypothetical protein
VTQGILDPRGPIHSLVLVGDYGSGKTEVAVNLAIHLAGLDADGAEGRSAATPRSRPSRAVGPAKRAARAIAIADLDLVNPYFRSREAQEPLEQAGIRVVMPEGGHQYADLPILLPQVKGVLQDPDTLAVLDVGGDEAGSRALAGLAAQFDPAHVELWFVVNGRRPFCDSPEGVLGAIRRVEAGASGWRVTGLVSNTHLMEETTAEMVEEGLALSRTVAVELGIRVAFLAAMEQVAAELDPEALRCPVLTMKRLMVPPWVRRPGADVAAQRLGTTES